ncbi:hypothetical protein H312_03398, partial [Anncaliia algerae PRA339]
MNFVDPRTGVNTQGIENRWSIYKLKFRSRYITCKSELSLMLSEFMFNLNLKKIH